MAKLTEDPKPEHETREKSEETIPQARYKKRFEDAVEDAQYLLIYASSNCPNDIKRSTLEKLITVRRRIENNQDVNAKEEADFWLAYQELWKLVKPVTAESVKANLPLENTLISNLLGRVPFLSRWLRRRTATKARVTVNRYIFFTVLVLILLLILQIYWVIGNQLTTQLTELLQREAEISLQINENQQEYKTLEILYKQNEIDSENFKTSGTFTFYSSPEWERDTLENISTRTRLESDLELLKSQLERNSSILLIWSSPWDQFINEVPAITNLAAGADEPDTANLTPGDEYALQIASLQAQIDAIDRQLADDPDGMKAADLLNSTLNPRLKSVDEQLGKLYADNNELYIREAEIQEQIADIQAQLNALSEGTTTAEDLNGILEAQLTALRTQEGTIESQIQAIENQLSTLALGTEIDESLKSALEAQLAGLIEELGTVKTQIVGIENQLSAISGNTNALDDLETQLIDLNARKKFNTDQIQSLQSESRDLIASLVPAGQLVIQWNQDKQRLTDELNTLIRQAQADARRESSRQAQLAGQFVLVILQSYLLPLLYGILGASTSVLRSLSKEIENVVFSDGAGIQHLLRVSLGALAGIMVGWFSFLLPNESSSFLGQVSPLAIAFLVGYNIELFFSMMDIALNKVNEIRQKSSPDAAVDPTTVSETDSNLTSTEETASDETPPNKEESVG
jgi:hypothetical protein